MRQILSVTIPVYLLIAVGWIAVRMGMFSKPDLRILGKLVVSFCLPALVFHALSTRDIADVLHPAYLLAYGCASLLVQLGGLAWARRVQRKPWSLAALTGLGMSASNSGFVGLPIVQALIGPIAGVALALNMLVENLVVIPLALALAERDGDAAEVTRRWHDTLRQTLRGLLVNPLILAILAGLAFALLGLRLPEPVARAVQMASAASSPLALFLIGGTLVGLKVRGLLADVALVLMGKLILLPACVAALLWLLAGWLPPVDPLLQAGAVLMAAMPMMSIYPVLAQKHGHEVFCAAALLAATVVSFFTVSAWTGWLAASGALPG